MNEHEPFSGEDLAARERLFASLRELDRRREQERTRLEAGFDGLLEAIPLGTSALVEGIVCFLQHYLQAKYSDARAQQLLGIVMRGLGPPDEQYGYGNIPADDLLALRLLGIIQKAIGDDKRDVESVFLGPLGVHEAKRRCASKRPRRPHIDEFIRKRLLHEPSLKGTDLWASAPCSITDEIGKDRFLKRVTKARKEIREAATK